MKNCFQSIMPDSLTGAILAVEGIKEGTVLLNGPTGCKLYHSAISDEQLPTQLSFDPLNYPEEFYFGQPRVPCTYLDGYDYVYGSQNKLIKLLRAIKSKGCKLLAVINSPGAALIGDDLDRLIKEEMGDCLYFSMESTGFSGTFNEGFQNAIINLLSILLKNRNDIVPKSVNLIGISIYDKYFQGNIKEIKRLLKLCNIKTISTICVGESIENIKDSLKAEYNVVLYPEYGLKIAKWMEEKFNIPYMILDEGVPIGFEGTENFVYNICYKLNGDNTLFKEKLERAKARSYIYISRFNSLTGLPKGCTFSIRGETSTAYALAKWLYSYLGMIPLSIEIPEGKGIFYEKLYNFLDNIGYKRALTTSISENTAHIVFGDGNTILQLRAQGKKFTGVEISLPTLGYIDVVPKSIFGIKGSLMIVEQILNSLSFMDV